MSTPQPNSSDPKSARDESDVRVSVGDSHYRTLDELASVSLSIRTGERKDHIGESTNPSAGPSSVVQTEYPEFQVSESVKDHHRDDDSESDVSFAQIVERSLDSNRDQKVMGWSMVCSFQIFTLT